MASISAYVLIGQSHSNEIGHVDTQYILELWEGDKAAWISRDVARNEETRIPCGAPSEINSVLITSISEIHCKTFNNSHLPLRMSVLIVPLPNSSLEMDTNQLLSQLSDIDIDCHWFNATHSKVINAWNSLNSREE
jgi:hypothetical protein